MCHGIVRHIFVYLTHTNTYSIYYIYYIYYITICHLDDMLVIVTSWRDQTVKKKRKVQINFCLDEIPLDISVEYQGEPVIYFFIFFKFYIVFILLYHSIYHRIYHTHYFSIFFKFYTISYLSYLDYTIQYTIHYTTCAMGESF